MNDVTAKKIPEEMTTLLKKAHQFETLVILVLAVTVGIITIMAMVRLILSLYGAIFVSWDMTDSHFIQPLFGMVMTVLIALELGNSILRHIREHSTIIQAQEVLLIGMMAVVRKVMIIDMATTSAWQLGAIGLLAVSLASAYWLMKE